MGKSGQKMMPTSPWHQQNLCEMWDGRVNDPFAFIPHELREKISIREAMEANLDLGKFAIEFLKEVLRNSTTATSLERRLRALKQDEPKHIVAVGYGQGHDGKWLKAATEACLKAYLIEVSSLACEWAEADMDSQYAEILGHPYAVAPEVEAGDLCDVLQNAIFGLDSVEVWYLCRVLNCLSDSASKFSLGEIGRTMKGDSSVVLINAFRDHNPKRTGKTSRIFSKKEVLSRLKRGAGHPVEVVSEESYNYFSQTYTALEVKLK